MIINLSKARGFRKGRYSKYWKRQSRIKHAKINHKRKILYNFSQDNIQKPTLAEVEFSKLLDRTGTKYLIQPYSYGQGRAYIPDFVLEYPYFIIFEIDGSYHKAQTQREKDDIRDKYYRDKGYEVMRFDNNEVLNNSEETFNGVCSVLNSRKRLNQFCKCRSIFYWGQVREVKPTRPITCSVGQRSNTEITKKSPNIASLINHK